MASLFRRNINFLICDMAGTVINENGIIYNYDYNNQNESSLENLLAAKEIYKKMKKIPQLIFTEILIGEVFRKFVDNKRAEISFEEAFNSSIKIVSESSFFFS